MTTSATTYYLETFGCQMNVLDSELVDGQLRGLGLTQVEDPAAADVVLFNTCSVRQHAEDKVLSRLGNLKRTKRRRPELVIGVIGCMAEREKEGLFVKAPQVDLLCGPGELDRLPGLLQEVWARHERVTALAGSLSRRTEALQRALEYDALEALDLSRAPAGDESVLQSYIRVQRGCDKFCTYCVVPFTRGAERSRPAAHIVAEARMLAERGCREVTLLGQTVNSYVQQEDGRAVRFAELLERVHAVEGLDRIRFVTSFPADWDEDIFRVMRDYPKVMPYLHIPAQSGSDAVLQRMRRTYTAGEYFELMDLARKYVPHISLASDFIVGFSGESEADFQQTVAMVRRVEFKNIFVFKYSTRPGTAAERNLDDDVPYDVKARRNNELLAVQAEIGLRQKEAAIGRSVEVLVEGFSKIGRRQLSPGAMDRNGEPIVIQESEQDRGREVRRAPVAADRAAAGAGVPACDNVFTGDGAGGGVNGSGAAAPRGQLVGRSPGDVIVVFDGSAELIGSLVRVRVEAATPQTWLARFEAQLSPPRAAVVDRAALSADGPHYEGGRMTLPVVAGETLSGGCQGGA